jgi:hypothetical protein
VPFAAVTSRLGRIGATVSLAVGAVALTGALTTLGSGSPVGASTPPPVIYVGNVGNGTITSYPLPSTGNVTPSATNTSSSLNGPYSETLDAAGDLWVANFGGGTLTEFSQAQLASSGAPTPIVTISSNGTSLETPEGLGFTPSGDLWVVDTHGNGLSMFTPAQLAASGTPTPTVAITGSAFDEPEGLAVTASGGLLVANYGDSNLLEYSASQLVASGSPTPAVTLAGSGLNGPFDVALDAGGNAWVCNYGSNTLVEYTAAQLAAGGSPTPTVSIPDDGTTTSIHQPYQLQFDSTGHLWITNNNNSVSGYASSQLVPPTAAVIPTYKIIGSNTGLDESNGLALATPPQAPTGVTAALSGSTSATVTWNPLPGPVWATDYLVTPVVNGVTQPTIDTGSTATSFSYGLHGEGPLSFTVSAANVFGTGPASAASNALNEAPGYWLVASDGGIFAEGSAGFHGSLGNIVLNKPIVGMAATPSGNGYWLVASDGGVFTEGDAKFYGSTGNIHLNKPIVGMASTPDGKGYWLVASDGGIFSFGDAQFYGSLGNIVLNKPIVGMASTPDGSGYWLVASDGGIFSKGDAVFHGSQGATVLNQPIVGMAATPDGGGYWLVASDGGIFTHGDATFYGSQGATRLNQPIVGMAATPDGGGYWLVASDGGIFSHGDATFGGSLGNIVLNKPIVGMAG